MLSGSNDEKLTNKKVDLKVVPFYQVWQELVHVQTLDVYQYRVLTSFSALKELLSVIKKTQQGLLQQMIILRHADLKLFIYSSKIKCWKNTTKRF